MSKFELREIGKDWEEDGTLLSNHSTLELAEKQMNIEASKRVKKVYYVRKTEYANEKFWVYDYGLYNRFLKIKEVEQ